MSQGLFGQRPLFGAILRRLPSKDDINAVKDAINSLPEAEAKLSDPFVDQQTPLSVAANTSIVVGNPFSPSGYLSLVGYALADGDLSLAIEISPDGVNYIPQTTISLTANTLAVIYVPVIETQYRVRAINTGTTAVNLQRLRIRGSRSR